MKAQLPLSLSKITDSEEFQKYAAQSFDALLSVVNGQVQFSDNIKSQIIEVNFNVADTELPVKHGLGIVATGYFKIGSSAAMSLYDGLQASTVDTVYIRSSAVGIARVMVF